MCLCMCSWSALKSVIVCDRARKAGHECIRTLLDVIAASLMNLDVCWIPVRTPCKEPMSKRKSFRIYDLLSTAVSLVLGCGRGTALDYQEAAFITPFNRWLESSWMNTLSGYLRSSFGPGHMTVYHAVNVPGRHERFLQL